ncbi:MAG: hypothetical protein SFZ23_13480 [Planctomycetota bacterium]|nr:hypothetical protein [Planctomycetota bacterium]
MNAAFARRNPFSRVRLDSGSSSRALLPAALVLFAGVAGLSGCVGYSSYPIVETAHVASTDPNLYTTREVSAVALAWVISRYPPESARGYEVLGEPRAYVNAIPDLRRSNYLKLSERVTKATGIQVLPVDSSAGGSGLPIYHVGRVWVRQGDAKVDILRPISAFGPGPDGRPVYQCVTVMLQGGLGPWTVKGTLTREPGLVDVPPLYYIPATDEPLPPTDSRSRSPRSTTTRDLGEESVEVEASVPATAGAASTGDRGAPANEFGEVREEDFERESEQEQSGLERSANNAAEQAVIELESEPARASSPARPSSTRSTSETTITPATRREPGTVTRIRVPAGGQSLPQASGVTSGQAASPKVPTQTQPVLQQQNQTTTNAGANSGSNSGAMLPPIYTTGSVRPAPQQPALIVGSTEVLPEDAKAAKQPQADQPGQRLPEK